MTARLGIIGGGNMGRAIAVGAVRHGVLGAQDLVIAEVDGRRRDALEADGLAVTADPAEAADAGQIMLAVKPQVFSSVATAIGPLAESKVVISIMAGRSTRGIRAALGPAARPLARVVRVMPNTPCQVGAGVTAVALGEGAVAGDEALAVALFEALGTTVPVNESQMHAVTAVSGSGPAYVFLLAEAMERAAVELGLDPAQAAALVRQTVLGAGTLLVGSGDGPAALRRAVTSPGGTTEAALEVMGRRDLVGLIGEAIAAARDRGEQLDQ